MDKDEGSTSYRTGMGMKTSRKRKRVLKRILSEGVVRKEKEKGVLVKYPLPRMKPFRKKMARLRKRYIINMYAEPYYGMRHRLTYKRKSSP